jgi:hypothetical protein
LLATGETRNLGSAGQRLKSSFQADRQEKICQPFLFQKTDY